MGILIIDIETLPTQLFIEPIYVMLVLTAVKIIEILLLKNICEKLENEEEN